MRVVAVHPDALVVTSRMWQTNAVLLRAPRAEGTEGDPAEAGSSEAAARSRTAFVCHIRLVTTSASG